MNKEVQVTKRPGAKFYIPVNDDADYYKKVFHRKTFSEEHLKIMRNLGATVTIVDYKPEELDGRIYARDWINITSMRIWYDASAHLWRGFWLDRTNDKTPMPEIAAATKGELLDQLVKQLLTIYDTVMASKNDNKSTT